VERLRRIRTLLSAQQRHGADQAKLACFGAAGFSDELLRAADRDSEIVLIGVEDLYRPWVSRRGPGRRAG
jgi:uncharacterized protein